MFMSWIIKKDKVSVIQHKKPVLPSFLLLFLLLHHQHGKSVLSSLLFLLHHCYHRLCPILTAASFMSFKYGCSFWNVLPKQKFIICCRAENSLIQITGHRQNFGTAQPPQVFMLAIHTDNTPILFDWRAQLLSLTAASSSLCITLLLQFTFV